MYRNKGYISICNISCHNYIITLKHDLYSHNQTIYFNFFGHPAWGPEFFFHLLLLRMLPPSTFL